MAKPGNSVLAALPLLLLILAVLAGYFWWRSHAPKPAFAIERQSFSALPGWMTADPRPALSAFRRSCSAIGQEPKSKPVGINGYAGTAGQWQAICDALPGAVLPEAEARAFFTDHFTPVAILADGTDKGLFTGYYEPVLKASRTRQGPYQIPVYGVPDDLVRVDLGLFRPQWKGEELTGRLQGRHLVPYPARGDIDTNGLPEAPVLFYAEDPVALFFLHVQGSGRVLFEDGTRARVVFAAKNGRPYTAIGRTLIAKAALSRAEISLQSIRAWLHAHGKEARAVMETNESYVFFALAPEGDPALGSKGGEGVALTPGASLAVDTRFHGFGTPLFVTGRMADGTSFARLLIAQDTGGAIKGAVRGDVYWGVGAAAEKRAGPMKMTGRLYALVPKSLLP